MQSRLVRFARLALAASAVSLAGVVALSGPALAQQPAPPGMRRPPGGRRPPPPIAPTPTPTASTIMHPAGGDDAHHGAEHGEHGEHAEAGEHEGHHGPEALNWGDISDKKRPALVALVINFGVLITVYYLLGKKPVANALKQRRVTIGKDMDEAQKLLDEAKDRAKIYQSKDATVDGASAKATMLAAGKGEVEKLLAEAHEKAERMKRDADRLVEQERKAAQQDILAEVIELAGNEATQLLQKSVTADDHARLAQDLLLELARRPAARAAPKTSAPPPATPSTAPAAPGAAS